MVVGPLVALHLREGGPDEGRARGQQQQSEGRELPDVEHGVAHAAGVALGQRHPEQRHRLPDDKLIIGEGLERAHPREEVDVLRLPIHGGLADQPAQGGEDGPQHPHPRAPVSGPARGLLEDPAAHATNHALKLRVRHHRSQVLREHGHDPGRFVPGGLPHSLAGAAALRNPGGGLFLPGPAPGARRDAFPFVPELRRFLGEKHDLESIRLAGGQRVDVLHGGDHHHACVRQSLAHLRAPLPHDHRGHDHKDPPAPSELVPRGDQRDPRLPHADLPEQDHRSVRFGEKPQGRPHGVLLSAHEGLRADRPDHHLAVRGARRVEDQIAPIPHRGEHAAGVAEEQIAHAPLRRGVGLRRLHGGLERVVLAAGEVQNRELKLGPVLPLLGHLLVTLHLPPEPTPGA